MTKDEFDKEWDAKVHNRSDHGGYGSEWMDSTIVKLSVEALEWIICDYNDRNTCNWTEEFIVKAQDRIATKVEDILLEK